MATKTLIHKESCTCSNIKSKPIQHTIDTKTILWLLTGAAVFGLAMLFEYIIHIPFNRPIALILFGFSYLLLGGNVLFKMLKNIKKGQIFDENFLIGIATIGAIVIEKIPEAVTVMLFYQIGEFFQEVAVNQSRKQIGALMDIRPDYANLLIDGEITIVSPKDVQIGDLFEVKPGEKIPLDGLIVSGESMIDNSALTGESIPKRVRTKDTVLSGCINQNGVLTIQATHTFGESTVSKILKLVEHAADKKAPTETFITKFARYYTPAVVISAVLLAIIPPLFFGGLWSDWMNRALIFLVISCPCALVVSIPLGFFGGIGNASKKGILVKGGNYLEALANLDIVVFDKTGTLTKGTFQVTELHPTNGYTQEELLQIAAYAECFSNHPIAQSILKEYGKNIDKNRLKHYEELTGLGIKAHLDDQKIYVGNEKWMAEMNIPIDSFTGIETKVYVALNHTYVGCLFITDEIKADSYNLVRRLKKLGVRKTTMLTGDNKEIGALVGNALEFDDIYAELLPQQKVEQVETLNTTRLPKKTLAFVGDGINDAPVLALADIGIAMGGLGSDAAIEAADVVLMTDEPSKLIEGIQVARFTKRIVWQNIILSLGVKLLFLFLATLGVSSLWEAVFADVGVALIAVLNSMRVLNS